MMESWCWRIAAAAAADGGGGGIDHTNRLSYDSTTMKTM
jgi:hypothetical protein